ncbi:514_t:CDS:2 [Paraglomus brasilianum]|uniref:514_t:CDS:1 n=1 Tax=Paraglomus brasilianum TaxID=144538 RepID=A0A9N9F0Y8_9GLOM|nr:514_t:CDS:2 [Paraglomus brasilianum]
MSHIKASTALAAIARQNTRSFIHGNFGAKSTVSHHGFTNRTASSKIHAALEALRHNYSTFNSFAHTGYRSGNVAIDASTQVRSTGEYNSRILALKREGDLIGVEREFNRMKSEGVALTTYTYNLVLDAHASLRSVGHKSFRLLEVYTEMLNMGIVPDNFTYMVTVRGLSKRDVEVNFLLETLENLPWKTSKFDDEFYKRLESLRSEGNLDHAMSIFESTRIRNNVHYDLETCNSLLHALAVNGRTVEALVVFQYIEAQQMQPSASTYASLIQAYGMIGDTGSASDCLREYETIVQRLPQHDPNFLYCALIAAYVKNGEISEAIDVIEKRMPENNVASNVTNYYHLIKELCKKGYYDVAHEWYGKMSMEECLPLPNRAIHETLLFHYSLADKYKEATEVYEKMVKADIIPRYNELAAYIYASIENDPDRVCDLIDRAIKDNMVPDIPLIEHVVSGLIDSGRNVAALKIFDNMIQLVLCRGLGYTLSKLNLIADSLLNDSRITLEDALALMIIYANTSTNTSYNTANSSMHHARRNFRFSHAMNNALLDKYIYTKDQYGPPPLSKREYGLLFKAAIGQTHDEHTPTTAETFTKRIFSILEDSKLHNALPTRKLSDKIHQHLLQTCGPEVAQNWAALTSTDSIRWPTAEEIRESDKLYHLCCQTTTVDSALVVKKVRDMIAGSVYPTPEVMGHAIRNVGKAKNIERSKELFDIALEVANVWNNSLKNHAIYLARNNMVISYATVGNIEEALSLYYQVLENGQALDSNAYASLLLAESDKVFDEADIAINMYKEAKQFNVKLNLYFYNVLISKVGKARKSDYVWEIYKDMKSNGIQPNAITYGALITACIRVRSEEHAVQLFKEMETSPNVQARIGPYNSMIQFYTWDLQDRSKALYYFDQLKARGMRPTEHTWKLLIDAYAAIEPYDMQSAMTLFDQMRKEEVYPAPTHFASLIYAYGMKQNNIESAIDTFESIFTEHKLRPDESAYQALFESLIEHQRLGQAEDYRRRMLEDDKVHTTPYIENLFIRGYGDVGHWEKAEAIFLAMKDTDHKEKGTVLREPSTYEVMVKAYVKNGKVREAKRVAELLERKEFPTTVKESVANLLC